MSGEDIIECIVRHIYPKKRKKLSIGVLVSGDGSNLQALIDQSKLQTSFYTIDSVITNNPHSKSILRARETGINSHVINHKEYPIRTLFEQQIISCLRRDEIELVVLAGFMRVLSSTFLSFFNNRVINLHPSLLPKHRGLNAIEKALLARDETAGCTVHLVDEGLDTGPAIAQSSCPILKDDDLISLKKRIQSLEHVLLPRVVNMIAESVIRRDFA